MDHDVIAIRGASEHNLRSVDLDIPKGRLVVFTGVSGSGKSSLAFDTLFAEGQRRYVESLSAYARQFLGQMDKPRYDSIRGLTPTIAVSQASAGRNPRSTVATMTEIHDHLRVLFARAGIQHCHQCGETVESQSAAEIASLLGQLPHGARFSLLAPVIRGRKGSHEAVLDELRRAGFARLRVDGEVTLLEDLQPLDPKRRHQVEVVVDRLRMREGLDERLTDSVETTLKVGGGVLICAVRGEPDRLYSELRACHDCGLSFPELTPQSFSFNSPQGMCPDCNGLGTRNEMDPELVVPDPGLTLRQGALQPWAKVMSNKKSWSYRWIEALGERYDFDLDTPWDQLSDQQRHILLHGIEGETFEVEMHSKRIDGTITMGWEGTIPTLMRRLRETKSEGQRKHYLGYMSDGPCKACGGTRLRPESAAVRLGDHTLPVVVAMPVARARQCLEAVELEGVRAAIASELLREVSARLGFLEDVGLAYLGLDRAGNTLSGGESQRIRLASQLGGELTGVTYVLDEPSIGLHPRDNARLVTTLEQLRDAGNTVVVVEHDRDTILAADRVVDFGPGAGVEGGTVVFTGTPAQLAASEASITGHYISGRRSIPRPPSRRAPGPRTLRILGAAANNLREIDVAIPLGLLVAITGVSGAGKSSLVEGILSPALHNALHGARRSVGAHRAIEGVEQLGKIIDIDQRPIGRTPRSNPATYTKAYDLIRGIFAQTREARVRGYGKDRFSFNKKGGRCEACRGDGYRRVAMHFLPDVFVPCDVCKGQRFEAATLAVTYRGHSIADVLAMPVEQALGLFANHRKLARILQTIHDVGLGYLQLGQPSNTLSGGEAQRIKLARELARQSQGDTLYLLDEPTTGLHFEDIRKLMEVMDRLVAAGNTVVLVEHNLEVLHCADWIIDLGPEGGEGGGQLVAAGPPELLAATPASHTGQALREHLDTT